MRTRNILLGFAFLLLPVTGAMAQHSSQIVYDSINVQRSLTHSMEPHHNTTAWGANILVSTNGFGLGTFYRHEYSDDFAGFIDLSVSEAKDDQEVDFYDPYTGQTYTPGKINRFLMFPLIFGVEKRLFKDEIMDNFRPYVDGGIGPTMIFVFPYLDDYFSALGKGHPVYTGAAYAGLGAYFGTEQSNLMGINVRYYFIPYPAGLESFQAGDQVTKKNQFGGFYITLHFGNAW